MSTSLGSSTQSGPTPTVSRGLRCSRMRSLLVAISPSPQLGMRLPSSPTTCYRWGMLLSGTTSTLTKRMPACGLPSASRCCASLPVARAGRCASPMRLIPARCGRRMNSGLSSPGALTTMARSASASTSNHLGGPANASPSTSTTGTCSSM